MPLQRIRQYYNSYDCRLPADPVAAWALIARGGVLAGVGYLLFTRRLPSKFNH